MMDEKKQVGEGEDNDYVVGAEVQMGNNRTGIIRYRGPVHDAPGLWFGVELIAPSSDRSGNNGVRSKKRYFFAPNGRAVFIQKNKIKKVLNKNTKSQIINVVDPAKRMEARSPQEWSTNEVCRWLAKIEALEVVTLFLVHGVKGTELLKISPDDLEFKLGIKDKNLITKIIKAKERLEAQTTILPNVREGARLILDDFKEYANKDTIKAPVFLLGERGRAKSLILLNNASKKRDSYSIPEKLRGKLPRPKDSRRSPVNKPKFPPQRGSFRSEGSPGTAALMRIQSYPTISKRVQLRGVEEKEQLTISLGDDLNDTFEVDEVRISRKGRHRRSPSVTIIIDTKPMKEWGCVNVVKWINSLGGKTSTYSKLFREKNITGTDVLRLTNDNLKALGVAEAGVRKWLLSQRESVLRKQSLLFNINT